MTDPEQLGFRALADPTRREILRLLTRGDMTIVDVADNFDMTRAAVKKHLTILTDGGLVTVRAAGRAKVNSLNAGRLKELLGWFDYFDAFCDDRLAKLKSEIEKDAS